jgi:SpoIID/LytB domain protein
MHHRSVFARALLGAAALLMLLGTPFAGAALAEPSAAVPVIRIDGRGHGHGVGMSQWGAYTMARDGATVQQIIAAFYPGTALGSLGGEVVVVVDRRDHLRVQFPSGGEVRSSRSGPQHPGFPVQVAPGGTVDIVRGPDGYRVTGGTVTGAGSAAVRYSASSPSQDDCILVVCAPDDDEESPSTTTTTAPSGGGGTPSPAPSPPPRPYPSPQPSPEPAPAPQPSSQPTSPTPVWAVGSGGGPLHYLDRGRTYRGLLEVTGAPGAVKLRNHVDIETYLKGMAEVPGTWPAAAVQAQAVAARTYAMRAMQGSGELCDSESCQVYVGTAHESPGQVAAVEATRGMVVTYGGSLAATFYSASGGGFAANVAEGFGSGYDVPYLPAHPYKTAHPDEWALDVALTDVAARLGYPGTLDSVTVDQVGPSGRPLQMTLHGDAGPSQINPQDFRRRLGLRSTLFRLEAADAKKAPPPPPPADDPGVVGDNVIGDDSAITSSVPASPDSLSRGEEIAFGAPAAPDRRTVGFLAVASVVVGLLGLATVRRLAVLAPVFASDGVGRRPVGAPMVGVPWSPPGPIVSRSVEAVRALGARCDGRVAAIMVWWQNRSS